MRFKNRFKVYLKYNITKFLMDSVYFLIYLKHYFSLPQTWEIKISLKVYLSIFHIQSAEVCLKYSSISAGQNTNKSLHNLWSNGLVFRVQVYQPKDLRFKIIRWLKICLSFHPSKVNLMNIKDSWDLVVKSKSSQ